MCGRREVFIQSEKNHCSVIGQHRTIHGCTLSILSCPNFSPYCTKIWWCNRTLRIARYRYRLSFPLGKRNFSFAKAEKSPKYLVYFKIFWQRQAENLLARRVRQLLVQLLTMIVASRIFLLRWTRTSGPLSPLDRARFLRYRCGYDRGGGW